MKPVALLVCLCLSAALAPAAPPVPLVAGENDAEWQPLFRALAAQGAVRSEFTERRWFSFRKEPVVLHGEIRFQPGRGLSLRYTQPEERLMVIDDRGILLRDERGRTRELRADQRAGNLDQALLPVLSFDLPRLLPHFALAASRESDGAWRLEFTPKDAALARTLGALSVSGAGETVQRLEFRRSAKQRVEILIGKTEHGVTFSDEELRRFFRQP
jgi:hypothetical protein